MERERSNMAYRTGARDVVGFRLMNGPGYLLDEIKRLDAEVMATDADFRGFLQRSGCAYLRNAAAWSDPLAPGSLARDREDQTAIAVNPPACAKLTAFYDGPWASFATQWGEFRDGHDAGGITGVYERFWGSLMETIDAYRESLIAMRIAALGAGFALGSPSPVSARKGAFDAGADALSGVGDMIKTAFYAVLIVGGVLLLIWGIGALGKGGGTIGGGRILALGSGR